MSQAGDKLTKMLADIRRFIYMREKYCYHTEHFPTEAVPLDYLLPYPGPYFDTGIDMLHEGVEALDTLYPEYRQAHSPERFVEEATQTARIKVPEFFQYREKWEGALANLDKREAQYSEGPWVKPSGGDPLAGPNP